MSENKLIPTAEEIKGIEVLAKYACESKFFKKLGELPGIFSIMMYAKEIGVNPMQAVMGGMYSIDGKIELSSRLLNLLIRKNGHKLKIIISNDEICTIEGTRKDTGESCTVSFSIKDAKSAGIFRSSGPWEKYPSDMCFARAISRLSRRLFPDVIGTSYVEGEIEEIEVSKQSKSTSYKEKEEEIIEVPDEDLDAKFFRTFQSLNQDDLNTYIASSKNTEEVMKRAISNVEGFKEWFIIKYPKKDLFLKTGEIDIIQAMEEGKL